MAAIVGLFVVASRSGEGTSSVVNRPPVAQGAPGGQSMTRSRTEARRRKPARPAAKRAPAIPRIVVRGGKPVRGVTQLQYKRGARVRFSVQTDAADDVHVHGFDITKDVPANRRVRFAFPADIEGVFEVELHGTHTTIAELRIKP